MQSVRDKLSLEASMHPYQYRPSPCNPPDEGGSSVVKQGHIRVEAVYTRQMTQWQCG